MFDPCRLPADFHLEVYLCTASVKKTQKVCHFDPVMVDAVQSLVESLVGANLGMLAAQLWAEFCNTPDMDDMPIVVLSEFADEVCYTFLNSVNIF